VARFSRAFSFIYSIEGSPPSKLRLSFPNSTTESFELLFARRIESEIVN
jgi:hypothetical protein